MDNVLSLLGLAYRANKILFGEEILKHMKEVKLIFLANDISDKSRERYLKKCEFYKVNYIDSYSGEELSNAVGKSNIKTIGIIDSGFAKSFMSKM